MEIQRTKQRSICDIALDAARIQPVSSWRKEVETNNAFVGIIDCPHYQGSLEMVRKTMTCESYSTCANGLDITISRTVTDHGGKLTTIDYSLKVQKYKKTIASGSDQDLLRITRIHKALSDRLSERKLELVRNYRGISLYAG